MESTSISFDCLDLTAVGRMFFTLSSSALSVNQKSLGNSMFTLMCFNTTLFLNPQSASLKDIVISVNKSSPILSKFSFLSFWLIVRMMSPVTLPGAWSDSPFNTTRSPNLDPFSMTNSRILVSSMIFFPWHFLQLSFSL
ncbi:hypothetical protein WICPIJ_009232 [Wickerhamomyces pijperi]|uniref:Uncharacterized protein n=1 Tax=Wickerhamomyces pijperi TaxID=599730 RepID=A0A9P8PR32_WICPI|nr:hypothetical protein WICPIJ_009232 [Wickerhamomyces pijperi]